MSNTVINEKAWLSWQEALDFYSIQDFELLAYLKEGLQPYTHLGVPIFCPIGYHKFRKKNHTLASINNELEDLKGLDPLDYAINKGELIIIDNNNPNNEFFYRVARRRFNKKPQIRSQNYGIDILEEIDKEGSRIVKIKGVRNDIPFVMPENTQVVCIEDPIHSTGPHSTNSYTFVCLYIEDIERLKLRRKELETWRPKILQEIENIRKKDPLQQSWKYFVIPGNQYYPIDAIDTKLRQEIILDLKKQGVQFKAEDVLEIGRKHNLKPSKTYQKPSENQQIGQSNVFRQEGPSWTIIYEGKTLTGLTGKGFEIIHYLILNKRKIFHTDELRIEVDKTLPIEEKSLSGSNLDYTNDLDEKKKQGIDARTKIYGKPMEALKKHRTYLKDEIGKAEFDNDPVRKVKFEEKFEEFNKHCIKYFNQTGKSRKDRDNTIKTKDRICKRIERALDKLKKHDQNIWLHFHNTLKPINSYFQSYQPDRDIEWLTE